MKGSTAMGSSTRLLVLGVVRIFQPVHGYDVRRELLEWRVDSWAHVAPGSIYHQLRALARDGQLEVSGVDQQGGRPARTSYQLTPEGEATFFQLLRDGLEELEPSGMLVMAALPFFPLLARGEVVAALESRASRIESYLEESAGTPVSDWGAPAHVAEIFSLASARMGAGAAWARELARRLREGQYVLAGEQKPGDAGCS